MNEPYLILSGNLADDPEIRLTPSGVPVCKFRMAQTPRVKDGTDWKDGEPFWQSVTAWRDLATNAAESLRRGDRVVVTGTLTQRTVQNDDGTKRTFTDLTADDIGMSVRFATVKATKVPKGDRKPVASGAQGNDDPWGGAAPAAPATPSAETSRAAQKAAPEAEAAPW